MPNMSTKIPENYIIISKIDQGTKPNYIVNELEIKSIKGNIKTEKEERHKTTLVEIKRRLTENENRLNDITQEKGASNWLAAYPISDQGYDLNKQQFWDSIRLRYGWRQVIFHQHVAVVLRWTLNTQ